MKHAYVEDVQVVVSAKWKCPDCGHQNEYSYHPGPYRAAAENTIDEQCENCEEFFTMNYFAKGYLPDGSVDPDHEDW